MIKYGLDRGKELMESIDAKVVVSEAPMRMAGWHLMGTAKWAKIQKDQWLMSEGDVMMLKICL